MTRWLVVAGFFALSVLGSAAFAASYSLGLGTPWAGGSACVAFAALAAALVVWEHGFEPITESVEEREALPSDPATVQAAEEAFQAGYDVSIGRPKWLALMLGGAFTAIGVAILFPIRSLTPYGIDDKLRYTDWRRGLRAVRIDGKPVKPADLEIGSVETVFPEGFVGPAYYDEMANDATVLVRVPPTLLRLPPGRASWSAQGILAYSKVCTHAGCPLGLYRSKSYELFCPCHQSTFDVLTGGSVLFGPAGRPLPQLPIALDDQGYIVAQSDYQQSIGPGYWERG